MNVGTMVHCLACNTVVWSHDSGRWGDVRGLLNAMRIPCRLCGDKNEFKGYDGFVITQDTMESYGLPSVWMTMHKIAEENGLAWGNSPDLTWFSSREARANAAKATKEVSHTDLDSIDLSHDLGIKDLTSPFGDEF